jgi:hypothetical protein
MSHTVLHHLALVTDSPQLAFSELGRVGAALQKQATRDLGPKWGVSATVSSFASLEDVPTDYWPIIVRDDIEVSGAAGVHEDNQGQPFALVQFSPGWSLTASHEMCEMLVDPRGVRVIAGPSPKPGQHRVNFLVEVCDPSEGEQFGYTVNGVLVSDFYTQHFFDPVAVAGTQYSFTGAIAAPRQVLKGGYLSWHDLQSDHWFQETFFGAEPVFRDLGKLTQSAKSIRRQIYDVTPEAYKVRKPDRARSLLASGGFGDVNEGGAERAKHLRSQIEGLVAKR